MSTTVATEPFPYLIADGWWDEKLLDRVIDEFPLVTDPRWKHFRNEHEIKMHGDTDCWGPATHALLDQFREKADALGEAFDIPELTMETVGGGMHLIPPSGHLDVHVDFNRSPDTGLYRRLNLMCYLNPSWMDEGGHLELWNRDGKAVDVEPELNRTVIFASSEMSWHGHPRPAKRWRLSVAAYYFSPEPPLGYSEEHSTIWR